jgi:hypothetical protein
MKSRWEWMSSRTLLSRLIALGTIWLLSSAPASAQVSRIGNSIGMLEPGQMRGTDTAYDPGRDVYLLVTGYGAVYGIFVNGQGEPVTGAFVIMDGTLGFGHFPRAQYSRDALGGQGAFLVTWHHNAGTSCVYGRMVSMSVPGGVASGIVQLSDGSQGGTWWETGPAMAYSITSRRFLVAWRTFQYGIQGRFVDINGAPIGGILQIENPGGSRDPSAVWHPGTDDFGVAYSGFGAISFVSLRRVRAFDGYLWPRTDFGFSGGAFTTAVDVNGWNNQYVVAWAMGPGTKSATLDQYGTLLRTNLVTTLLGYDQSLALAFNPQSGTFVTVSSMAASLEIGAAEIKGTGEPNSSAMVITNGASLGSFYPRAAARMGTSEWEVVYSRDFRGATSQMIATSTTDGGGGGGTRPLTPKGLIIR